MRKTTIPVKNKGYKLVTDINDSIFLLNGSILYTDGTPSTTTTGAIQKIDTNKYKIKLNALVNISNATYINLSN